MYYAKKSLGQNYLIDLNIVKKIINLTKIYNKDILEIGPGKGALTEQILKNKPKSLILIEKDDILSKDLKLKYQNNKKIIIYNKDVLKFDFEEKLKDDSIIFGNLPYNISSQILAKIIKFKKWPPKYSDLIFMFQKEMAERIVGKFNTPKYGRLSILTNYRLKVLSKFNVSPNCFFPKPKVDSTILYFKPNKKIPKKIKNIENLEKITNILFSNKRKMINKGFSKLFKNPESLSRKLDINLSLRPEQLNENDFYRIVEYYEKYKKI
jgi:16S rRNA (adenine1518-N6/adenine1519-N6)-dimethyltransferase